LDTLVRIRPEEIEAFRDYLRTIPFRYKDPALSVVGMQLKTEGDVRMFFDSSILFAVWPVALAMVPPKRNADLVLTNQKTYSGAHSSRPDVSIIAYDGTPHPPTVAQIEHKGPRGLEGFRNVIRASSERRIIMPPEDWITVTSQLRKYAIRTGCRSILCSDDSDAYVFVFPADESADRIQFLQASDNGIGSLTLREAVLFLIYLGIRLDSPFTLRYVYTHFCPTCRGLLLSDVLFNLGAVLTTNRQFPGTRRSNRTAGDYEAIFNPIEEPQPASPSRVQPFRQSTLRFQPGNVVVLSTSTNHIGYLKQADKNLKIYGRLLVEIDEVVGEDVIRGTPLNSTNTGRIILKFFPADSARMLSEVHAYKALQPLQGSAVPECIGVFTVDDFNGYALGLSVVDGAILRQHFETKAPSIELFRSVWSQLRAVHDCGVAHMDVRAENILIKHDQSVVIIDFSMSL